LVKGMKDQENGLYKFKLENNTTSNFAYNKNIYNKIMALKVGHINYQNLHELSFGGKSLGKPNIPIIKQVLQWLHSKQTTLG